MTSWLRVSFARVADRGAMADGAERDCLPSQEARIKAGLEKAIQHKEKLLEFDRNR